MIPPKICTNTVLNTVGTVCENIPVLDLHSNRSRFMQISAIILTAAKSMISAHASSDFDASFLPSEPPLVCWDRLPVHSDLKHKQKQLEQKYSLRSLQRVYLLDSQKS